MYRHTKELQYHAKPERPDALFAAKLQELVGGQFGEMTVMMQYLWQGWNCRIPGKYKDMILDIGTEEIGHVEMLVTMMARLLEGAPSETQADAAAANPALAAVLGGMNVQHAIVTGGAAMPTNSQGVPWNGGYIVASGNLLADFRHNVAAEAQSRLQTARVYGMTDDPGVKDMLQFNLARDTFHQQQWLLGIEQLIEDGLVERASRTRSRPRRTSEQARDVLQLPRGQHGRRGPLGAGLDAGRRRRDPLLPRRPARRRRRRGARARTRCSIPPTTAARGPASPATPRAAWSRAPRTCCPRPRTPSPRTAEPGTGPPGRMSRSVAAGRGGYRRPRRDPRRGRTPTPSRSREAAMTTVYRDTAAARPLLGRRLVAALTTTDHKLIGKLYLGTSFGWFIAAGVMALLIRSELAFPGQQVMNDELYNQMFTMHGTIMLLLFATPLFFGFANVIMPLQIGAPDVAFPRLNMLSYWMYFFGGLITASGFLTSSGAADFGWTAYAPLSDATRSPGVGGDLWTMGLWLAGLGTILGAVNFVTTIISMRAPGMTMFRMPIFVWNTLITSLLVLIAFPVLAGALLSLEADRQLGAHVFDPAHGGAILWQHLFWFFGHPEVYIIALPFFGIITEVIPVFSRKPVFGYIGLVGATLAIALYSVAVWAHHMFLTNAVSLSFFSGMTFIIAVPTGVKFFNWIGTMWGGSVSLDTPMLWSVGFLVTFLFGGLTGVILASPPLDFHVSDSYFVVAHFHYVVFGTVVFAMFAGFYFWWPKLTGRMLDERIGKVHFWMLFIGFHTTFLVQHWLGVEGMQRRIADYLPSDGFTLLNQVSTVGAFLLGASTLPFFYNVYISHRAPAVEVDDPWGWGRSLEWATSCPPPRHNFLHLPRIRSEAPAFDLHHPEIALSEVAEHPRAADDGDSAFVDAPDQSGRASHLRSQPGPDPATEASDGADGGSRKPFVKRLLTALFVLLAIGAALGAMLLIGIRLT